MKFLRKYAAFTLLVIDEWLLDHPDESMRSMLLELLERRYDTTSTVFCTQYAKKDWHQRLGSGVHADAIMDRIVHNTIWIETGNTNMREHAALAR
jgi:DNA replication protein DnaC